jgi:hypothetical protein
MRNAPLLPATLGVTAALLLLAAGCTPSTPPPGNSGGGSASVEFGGKDTPPSSSAPARDATPAAAPSVAGAVTFTGRCDGSAVFAIDATHIAVASDEASEESGRNQIAVYGIDGGVPQATYSLNDFLQIEKKNKEADLEAAAAVGDRVYWIGSHARNKEGKERPARLQLFATTFAGGKYQPVGKPFHGLIPAFASVPQLAGAADKSGEDEGGLNIEGLAATPDGGLLIGFRNPVPGGKALLVPLTNPGEVIDSGAAPKLGAPVSLDLSEGGKYADRGVRDLFYDSGSKGFLVLAGSWRGWDDPKAAPPALFRWSGKPADAPERLDVDLSGLTPEAVTTIPGSPGAVLILSDDGNVDGCKDKPDAARAFRAVRRTVK